MKDDQYRLKKIVHKADNGVKDFRPPEYASECVGTFDSSSECRKK